MRSFIPSLGDKSDVRVEKEKDKMPPKRCMEEGGLVLSFTQSKNAAAGGDCAFLGGN